MKNKLTTAIFLNHCFDKRRFQNFIYWFFKKSHSGQSRLLNFLEKLKFLGFHSATQAGFSMSIDDLKIPSSKSEILLTAENIVLNADIQLLSGNLTIIERYQRIIEIWNRTSEELKYQVLQSFKISDFLNPVYLMAFSGARGNISQIRQLVGMRGLMADPQGQIIDFPIRSNFREGLTLTEYLISCSGARKGIVDTALRTAASGYLTRRLVDVAHHVIVHQIDCQMEGLGPKGRAHSQLGIWIEDLYDQQKKILSLQQRLVGRVLAETIRIDPEDKGTPFIIGQKDHEISKITSQKICKYRKKVLIRSPLTCQSSKFICQLCYGWNLAEGQLVSVGEAVGVLAAQSIGEPGTQMTMRTFHTGGVFTGILMDQTYAPFSGIVHYNFPCNGVLIRTLHGKIAYLSKNHGILSIFQGQKAKSASSGLLQNQPQGHTSLANAGPPSFPREQGWVLRRDEAPRRGEGRAQRAFKPRHGVAIGASRLAGRRPQIPPLARRSWGRALCICFILKKLRSKFYKCHYFPLKRTHSSQNLEIQNHFKHPLPQKRFREASNGGHPALAPPRRGGAPPIGLLAKRPFSNYKTLLHQLRKLNFQFKEMMDFNPIGFNNENDTNLTFLKKRDIHPKNKFGNNSNFLKISRKTGFSAKNLIARVPRAYPHGPSDQPSGRASEMDHILKSPYRIPSKLQKQIQFIFQTFTILYVRQNENVLKKQLIAELPFFENEKSFENEQEILSNESGEIYFEDFVLLEKTTSDFKNEIQFKKNFVQDLGRFWILFGRSFQHILMMEKSSTKSFLKKLDLIDPNVPFSQIQIESHNFLNNEIDDLFYKNYFLQFEQLFLSSFLRKKNTSHKNPIFKQRIGSYRSNHDEYTLILKRAFRHFPMNSIFFKRLGYLQISNFQVFPRILQVRMWNKRIGASSAEGWLGAMTLDPKASSSAFDGRRIKDHQPRKTTSFSTNSNKNWIQKIQIFNGIEPISINFLDKNKVFWNYRKNYQRHFETWMIGLQGQSKYIHESSDFQNPCIKISIKHFQMNFLKQNSLKVQNLHPIQYIQNSLVSSNFQFIFNNIFSSLSFQKQKRKFFLSDTGLIFKKSKKFFCEFQNPYLLEKYKRYFIHLNSDPVILKNQFHRTFPAKSEKFFLNINLEQQSCILLVNRQGIFQSFGRKVLKNEASGRAPFPIRNGGSTPRAKGVAYPRWPSEQAPMGSKRGSGARLHQLSSRRLVSECLRKTTGTRAKSWKDSGRLGPSGPAPQSPRISEKKKILRKKINEFLWTRFKSPIFIQSAAQGHPFGVLHSGRGTKKGVHSLKHVTPFFRIGTQIYGFTNTIKQIYKIQRQNPKKTKIRQIFHSFFQPQQYCWSVDYYSQEFYFDVLKIQSIFCHLFLKQSRLFQNLPKNWARQITNIQPRILHWKNLPNQKYILLLNFITNFYSAKYIEQKNLKKIKDSRKRFASELNTRGASAASLQGFIHFQNEYYQSRLNDKNSNIDPFLEKSPYPKKQDLQQKWRIHLDPIDPGSEPLRSLRGKFLQWIGSSKNPIKNLLNIDFATQIVTWDRMMIRAKNQHIFQIKQHNFWKIQQRQEIIGFQKLKIGFYSWIRIFFSIAQAPSFEDLQWMNILDHPSRASGKKLFKMHPAGVLAPPMAACRTSERREKRGGEGVRTFTLLKQSASFVTLLFPTFIIFPKLLTNRINKPRWTRRLLPFDLTQHFFKTLKVQRARKKLDSTCFQFRQQIPQIFSIDEQKFLMKFIVHKERHARQPFSYFFIQKFSEIHLFLVQRHTHPKIFSHIPYKTVLNIQKNKIHKIEKKISNRIVLAESARRQKVRVIQWDPQVNISKKRKPILTPSPQLWTLKWTNFLHYHQPIFYGKFKKNFQNIHLNSSDASSLEMGVPFEDPCIQWKFFGDWTRILEKNIYSTYFKHFSPMEDDLNKCERTWLGREGLGRTIFPLGRDGEASEPKPRKPSAQGRRTSYGKNQYCTMYPSINKVLTSRFQIRLLDMKALTRPKTLPSQAQAVPEFHWNNMEIPTTNENRSAILPAISFHEKYLFDNILPRSLIRSEFGILKMPKGPFYNKMDFSKLQKWILDNYFDSYLLIVHDFSLLKNFESRFFQSLPKKPIYNKFYYHDNKIETELISEYTQHIRVKKNKLQEDILRKYSISNIRKNLINSKSLSTLFSNSINPLSTENEFIVNFMEKPSKNWRQQDSTGLDVEDWQARLRDEERLHDFFEFPSHLYNFYIEYISKKSSRFQYGFYPIKNLYKMNMKTWFNSFKNFQKYSSRYLKSQILSKQPLRPLFVKDLLQKDITNFSGLRYPKYLRVFIVSFFQKFEVREPYSWPGNRRTDQNNSKQYCFVLKFYLKNLDNFYSVNFPHSFFSQQNRKSFRIPFLGFPMVGLAANLKGESLFLNPSIIKPNIDIFRTTLNFKTYEIFKIFLSIFVHYQKSISIQENVHVFKLFQKKLGISFGQSSFHRLFNLMSLTLQTEYLKNFSLQNPLKYQIPLLDKKFEIFLVSIIPIMDARAPKASCPDGTGVEGVNWLSDRTQNLVNPNDPRPFYPKNKIVHQPLVHNWKLIDNHTHSLKIHITKTKYLNFLTQKYLTTRPDGRAPYFRPNRTLSLASPHLLSLSKVLSQRFSSLQFDKNQTKKNLMNFQIIKKSFLNSSEIQIFIRFFLPLNSGEIMDPLLNQQGSQIVLFANVSDFFSYRQNNPTDLVSSDVLNSDNQVILEKNLNYFLKNQFLGKIQKINIDTFLLKNPSIFYRLQLQRKKKWSRGVLSIVSNWKSIKFPQKSKIHQYKSDLDCLNPFDFPLQTQQRIKKNKNFFFKTQQLFSQKILDSYKFSQNLNSRIWAFMDPILTKNVRSSSFQYFTNFNKSFWSSWTRRQPGVVRTQLTSAPKARSARPIDHSLEQPVLLGSFMRGGSRKPQTQFHFQGGQLIAKTQHILLFRKATTHLLNNQSILHIQHGDIIFKNQSLYSVFYHQSKTGDIVQGIPKIEEIFEARKKSKYSLHELPIFSKDFLFFEKIILKYLRSLQKSVVNNIQRIYCGQGIHISDKHIEIIVRQMTSNVLILEPGQTGLLYGEIVALQWISQINTISNQVIYEPVFMGMTKTCLETSNFLSAASFQETTRILGRAALQNQIDFIRGLKQNVILGNLIPIGTGCF